MAFPQITEVVNSQTASGTSHPIQLPGSLVPGNTLLLLVFCHGNLTLVFPPELTVAAVLGDAGGNGNVNFAGYVTVADSPLLPILGVESGERTVPGGVINCTTGLSRASDVYACAMDDVYPAAWWANAGAGGGATPVDPPNLAYSGSAKDVLWLAVASAIGWAPNGFPANYNLHQDTGLGIIPSSSTGVCARELNAASENPGQWPASAGPTSDWISYTGAVAIGGP